MKPYWGSLFDESAFTFKRILTLFIKDYLFLFLKQDQMFKNVRKVDTKDRVPSSFYLK